MTPEQKARLKIDELLPSAGWTIQDKDKISLDTYPGVAIREYRLNIKSTDYLLSLERKPFEIIEAKVKGITLVDSAAQSEQYLTGNLEDASEQIRGIQTSLNNK